MEVDGVAFQTALRIRAVTNVLCAGAGKAMGTACESHIAVVIRPRVSATKLVADFPDPSEH